MAFIVLNLKRLILVLVLFQSLDLQSQNADINLLKDINLNRNRSLDAGFRGISNSAAPAAFGIPAVILGVGLLRKDTLAFRKSLYIGASLVSTVILTNILKYTVKRSRPFETYPFIDQAAHAGSPSFPSGHTSDAFALATSLTITYPKWYVIVPSFLWAAGVGYSRLDLGVHYPTDVLAGAIIGAGSAFLCYKGQQWLRRK